MEQIAPLARILAEANGIDWQQLRGSGAGGMVVEQDILNYLSRVMSGEEEPPSTPVDEMPEGWTGDEGLPAGMFSSAQLSEAGIDSDIADFVTQARSPEVRATPATPSLNHDALDFELDDDMGDLDAPLAPEPQPVASGWSFAPAQAQAEPSPHIDAPQPIAPAPEAAFPTLSAPEPLAASDVRMPGLRLPEEHVPAASAPSDSAGGGLSGLLSRLYRKDKGAEAAPAPMAASTPMPAPQPAAPTLGQPDMTFAPTHQPPQPDIQPVVISAPAAGLDAPEMDVPEMDAPEVAAAELDLQAPAAEVPFIEAPGIEMPAIEAPVADLPVSERVYAVELAGPELLAPEAQAPELQAPEPQALEPEAPEAEAAVVPSPVAKRQPAAQSVAASPAMPAAVWFGTYLRRDAGVGAAEELCAQLSEALDQNVSLAFLVARAARHHADALGLDLGSVALHGAGGQDQTITGAAMRDALKAPRAAGDSAPDLLITDAAALGVDELHFPHTLTLSVGRVQDGRAALSLNGDVDPRQGAQFLARVAGALEKPIALVL